MKHFSITELTRSTMAKDAGILNEPAPEYADNLIALIDRILDPLREAYGKPIRVNSGYRCPALNKLIGGAVNSAHLQGQAADITAGNKDGNQRLFELAQQIGLPFDQLIDENKYSWIHISYKQGGVNRGQVLHLA